MIKMKNEGLQRNISIDTLVSVLSARAKITIWKSETEKLFDGYVYQLYDNKEYYDLYITFMRMDSLSGVSVIVTDEWK